MLCDALNGDFVHKQEQESLQIKGNRQRINTKTTCINVRY